MAKCIHCSANLPHGLIHCSYCGAVNDIDLEGRHYYTTNTPTEPRACPTCKVAMQCLDIGSTQKHFFIERCEKCLGLFFDPGELDLLVREQAQGVFNVDALSLNALRRENSSTDSRIEYRPCPICNKMMNRQNFGERSGVVIDRCRDHGVFLDGGELKRILLWVRLGGALQAEQFKTVPPKKEPKPQDDFTDFTSFGGGQQQLTGGFQDILSIIAAIGRLLR